MLETKALLEQKAISLTARAESVDELQEEMASIKVQLESLNQVQWKQQFSPTERTVPATHLPCSQAFTSIQFLITYGVQKRRVKGRGKAWENFVTCTVM